VLLHAMLLAPTGAEPSWRSLPTKWNRWSANGPSGTDWRWHRGNRRSLLSLHFCRV